MGRQSSYTEDKADTIIEKLAEGYSLRTICKDESMPNWRTVLRWQVEREDFASKCAHAREAMAEAEHEGMARIERGVLAGTIDHKAASVVLAIKRWRMEKLKSKAFGNKIQHADADGNNLPVPTFILQPVAPKADD